MWRFLRGYVSYLDRIIVALTWLAQLLGNHRNHVDRVLSKRRTPLAGLRGSIRSSLARARTWLGLPQPEQPVRRSATGNRTPDHVEVEVMRLHLAQPHLRARPLAAILERVRGHRLSPTTVRAILARRRELLDIVTERRRAPRKITVARPRELWGVDLTRVWLWGFLPAFVVGVIDYRGSRIVALERVARPTAENVVRVLVSAFARHGRPDRILSDNGPEFTAAELASFLTRAGVRHTFTKPRHPWTNGRIERLFRTFKETIFRGRWLIAGEKQLDRFCVDFIQFYNRDRPHQAYGSRTPDEVHFGKNLKLPRPVERVSYFDGALSWYRLG